MLTGLRAALSGLPDPYVLRIPGSYTVVAFFGYHGHVDLPSAEQCWNALNQEYFAHHRTELNLRVGTHVRTYVSNDGKTHLVLRPLGEMTWWNLWALALGLQEFYEQGQVESQFRFHVFEQRSAERRLLVGSGQLTAGGMDTS